MAEVVKNDHIFGHHEGCRKPMRLVAGFWFEFTAHLPAERTDSTARKGGEIRGRRGTKAFRKRPQGHEGALLGSGFGKLSASVGVLHKCSAVFDREPRSGVEANEGIAAEALAGFDGFEEKHILVILEPGKNGDGGFQIGSKRERYGNVIALLGESGKFAEGEHGGILKENHEIGRRKKRTGITGKGFGPFFWRPPAGALQQRSRGG